MTMSIHQTLATLPDGRKGVALSNDELTKYLREHYGERDQPRRERHRLRDEMYRDGGCDHMCRVIDSIFTNRTVRELRKKWVPHARFSNALKRIVGEMSTVYSEPSTRSVGGSDANVRAYADLVEEAQFDEVLDHANRMLNLHRAVLIGPRIRTTPDGAQSLVLDVVTPANTIAVVHPSDATLVVAWIIKIELRSARTEWIREPKWQLWSDHEVMYLDDEFRVVKSTPHTLGMNPWVPLTFSGESVAGFWPGEEGEDLIAAQTSIWFTAILMLKETKSATKVPLITGDTTAMAMEQAADTELGVSAPEGVAISTVDMGMDTGPFRAASDFALERAGNAYGLSMAGLTHQGTQSAEARQVMLEPLRQLRRKQVKTFRRAERRLAVITAAVCQGTAFAFTVERFSVDFGEPQVLQTEMERQVIFEKKRAAGMTNSVDEFRVENPDARIMTDEEVLDGPLARNIRIETARQLMMRAQQAISGTLGGRPEPQPGTGPQLPPGTTSDDSGQAAAIAAQEAA